jgi:hypothetical protein
VGYVLDAHAACAGFFRLPPHHRQQLVDGLSVGFLEIAERRGVRRVQVNGRSDADDRILCIIVLLRIPDFHFPVSDSP